MDGDLAPWFLSFQVEPIENYKDSTKTCEDHSYDILGAGMLWKPKEARILKNFINQPVNIR
jgi:hypothetical protein